MTEWLLKYDYNIFQWINQTSETSWQNHFFPWITDLHKSPYFFAIILPLIIFLFYRKYARQGISLFFILILSLAFNDFMGSKVKNHFLRPRPFQNLEIQAIQRSPADSKSFYSNHASNMFTFATYTCLFFPASSIPLFFIASVVGYSRIYNGVHYPSDVIIGMMMGLIWGSCFASVGKRIIKIPKKDST